MHFTIDTYLSFVEIILGLLAIAMATPTFIQMIFGAPSITIECIGGRYARCPENLACVIRNMPIESRFLRCLCVTRDIAEVSVVFKIHEYGTNKLVADTTVALLHGRHPDT